MPYSDHLMTSDWT